MRRNTTTLIVLIFGTLFITSTILGYFQPWNNDKVTIEFTHKEIKSYPGQTTWLVANVKINVDEYNLEELISIKLNQSIDFDTTFWTSQKNALVEIFLYPNSTHVETAISVTLSVNLNNRVTNESIVVKVVDWSSFISEEIYEMKMCFANYLIENIVNFNLQDNASLEFLGNIPQILIVEYYVYKTINWEFVLYRHVMIQPNDWVKIYIRSRDSLTPLWAGMIDSWGSGNHTIYEIEPPEIIKR